MQRGSGFEENSKIVDEQQHRYIGNGGAEEASRTRRCRLEKGLHLCNRDVPDLTLRDWPPMGIPLLSGCRFASHAYSRDRGASGVVSVSVHHTKKGWSVEGACSQSLVVTFPRESRRVAFSHCSDVHELCVEKAGWAKRANDNAPCSGVGSAGCASEF